MKEEDLRKRHPIQPVIEDDRGVFRFKKNNIVDLLLDAGPFDMNHIATWRAEGRVTDDDCVQFAQLTGYSLSGFGSLSYVDSETYSTAARMVEEKETELRARLNYLSGLVEKLKLQLREPMSELFDLHPDDLMEVGSRPVHNSATEEGIGE